MYDLNRMLEEIVEDERISKSRNRKITQREINKLLHDRRMKGPPQEDFSKMPLGKILLRDALITADQLQEALQLQSERGGRIGSILVQLGFIQDEILLKSLSKKYDTESVSLLDLHISEDVLNLIPLKLAQKNRLLPVRSDGRNLYLAMESPHDFGAIHEVEMLLGKKVYPIVTTSYQLDLAIDYLMEKGGGAFDGRELQQLLKGPMTMVSLLEALAHHEGSDLLVSVGAPPAIKKNGRLRLLDMPPISKGICEVYAKVLMTEQQWEAFERTKQITFISDHKSTGRLRVSAYQQRGSVSLSIRRIHAPGLELERLGLPAWLESVVSQPRGLVVVASPPGQGKTTTVTALLESINRKRCVNIVAIHECLEIVVAPKKSLLNHRVLGDDIHSMDELARDLSKQSADVLVLDEMRDSKAVEAALAAASSGCLVLATFAAFTARSVLEKMVDLFPPSRQSDVRRGISECLLLAFCQRLHSDHADEPPRVSFEKLGAGEIPVEGSSVAASADLLREPLGQHADDRGRPVGEDGKGHLRNSALSIPPS